MEFFVSILSMQLQKKEIRSVFGKSEKCFCAKEMLSLVSLAIKNSFGRKILNFHKVRNNGQTLWDISKNIFNS